MLDSKTRGSLGGTGISFDWGAAERAVRPHAARLVVAGGLTPANVAQAIETLSPDVVDVSSGVESSSGIKDHARMAEFMDACTTSRSASMTAIVSSDRFGTYGGRYVPETLIPALDSLEAASPTRCAIRTLLPNWTICSATYVGRPSPLSDAPRLSALVGVPVLLKREDLNHTGAHKINNTVGQALLARRMGKRRIIAETGADSTAWRRRPFARVSGSIAPCTWAKRTCGVGAECLSHAPHGSQGRSRPLRDANPEGRHQRGDPRLGHQRQRQLLHHRVGCGPGHPIRGWFGISRRLSGTRRRPR